MQADNYKSKLIPLSELAMRDELVSLSRLEYFAANGLLFTEKRGGVLMSTLASYEDCVCNFTFDGFLFSEKIGEESERASLMGLESSSLEKALLSSDFNKNERDIDDKLEDNWQKIVNESINSLKPVVSKVKKATQVAPARVAGGGAIFKYAISAVLASFVVGSSLFLFFPIETGLVSNYITNQSRSVAEKTASFVYLYKINQSEKSICKANYNLSKTTPFIKKEILSAYISQNRAGLMKLDSGESVVISENNLIGRVAGVEEINLGMISFNDNDEGEGFFDYVGRIRESVEETFLTMAKKQRFLSHKLEDNLRKLILNTYNLILFL